VKIPVFDLAVGVQRGEDILASVADVIPRNRRASLWVNEIGPVEGHPVESPRHRIHDHLEALELVARHRKLVVLLERPKEAIPRAAVAELA